jgi:hypothetical protein
MPDMMQFAELRDATFARFEVREDRPADIPHKGVTWHPVVSEYGSPFEGVEGDSYVIRTIDPATLPPPIPSVVSASAARRALLAANLLDTVEIAIASADRQTQIMWEYETRFRRAHSKIVALGASLGLDLDALFVAAGELDV